MKSTNTGRLSYKFLTFVIFLMCNISFFLCFVFTFINAAFSYLLHFYIFVFLLAAFAFCVVIYINILNWNNKIIIIIIIIVAKCLLSFGAESFVFQVAVQEIKDQDI